MDCKCKNGKDELDFLLPGTAEGTYVIGLTHNSCGNRQMLLADPHASCYLRTDSHRRWYSCFRWQ